jgi:hypothetical protein
MPSMKLLMNATTPKTLVRGIHAMCRREVYKLDVSVEMYCNNEYCSFSKLSST